MKQTTIYRSWVPILLGILLNASLGAQEECSRTQFDVPPRWVYSGASTPSGTDFVLVDVLQKSLLVYDMDGQIVREVTASNFSEGEIAFRPSFIQRVGTQYFVETVDGVIVTLDEDFHFVEMRDLYRHAFGPNQEQLRGVWSWAYQGSDSFLVVGDAEKEDGSFIYGLFKTKGASLSLLFAIEKGAPRDLYMVGNRYLTDSGYFLTVDESLTYYRLLDGEVRQVVDSRFARPNLPPKSGPGSVVGLFAAIETQTMPTALVGTGDSLVVLSRAPAGGSTEWSISRLDERAGALTHVLTLPSTADHLLPIRGESYWTFVEKGRVNGLGQQSVGSALFIPTTWIETLPPGSVTLKESSCQ